MRILVFLLFSFTASAQIPLYQLEYALDSNYIMGALPTGEATWVHKDSVSAALKVKNSPTMLLRIENDSIRADIKKRLNAINVGGQGVYLSLQIDSTGQIFGYNEILSDDFDKDEFNEIQTISIDSLEGVFYITLTDGGVVKLNAQHHRIYNSTDYSDYFDIPNPKINDLWTSYQQIYYYDGSGWVLLTDDADPINEGVIEIDSDYGDNYAKIKSNTSGSPRVKFKGENGIKVTVRLNGADVDTITTVLDTSFVKDIINDIISDSLANIPRDTVTLTDSGNVTVTGTYPNFNIHGTPDEIIRIGNEITLRDGDGSIDLSDLVNAPDSTIVQNSYGTIINESPANTWNVTVDSTKFVTPYDLTLLPNPPDSTHIVDGWGITAVESPTNTYNLMADSSQVFTQYDGTLKQDKLPSFTAGSVIFSNGTTLAQDNSNLFWDDSNNELEINGIPITSKITGSLNIGQDAGNNDSEYSNFIGIEAGKNASNADYSNFFGPYAGTNAINSYMSNFFGLNAGNNATNAYYSNFFGKDAGRNTTNANYSNYFGYLSGLNSSGFGNNFFGVASGANNTGNFNNFFGYESGVAIGNADYSNHFGFRAGNSSQGDFNDFFGANAGYSNSTGNFNFAVGLNSLYSNVSGSNNVSIGRNSGALTTGSSNLFLGYSAGYNETGSNTLYIENSDSTTPLIGGNFDNNRVGINTAIGSIANTLHVTGGVRITDLAGSGTRMVTTTADGDLGSAAIPTTIDSTGVSGDYGIDVTESVNVFTVKADTAELATPYDLTLKQDILTGANKRIPYFTGTNTISSSDNLSFDNSTQNLGIGTVSPSATIHMNKATGNRIRFTDPASGLNYKNWQIFAGSGADERNLSFQSLSDAGSEYNFMTWRKAINSQLISNLYIPHLATSSGTEVMTMNNVGEVYRDALKTINNTSLFGSGNITTESPLTFSSPLSRSSNTVSIPAATSSVSGHLTSTDWNTFNNKFTLPSLTSGSVLFSNGTTIAQDNANLFYDDSNNELKIKLIPYTSRATNQLAIGINAALSATSATSSNMVGVNAGYQATNAADANFFGSNAGYQATNASNSNFFGVNAGQNAAYAYSSNFIGNASGNGATNAHNSNFFGFQAGKGATNANLSTFIGQNTGATFSGNNIGSNNVVIGTNISLPNGRNNGINIGGLLFGTDAYSITSGNPSILAASSGKIGVLKVTPLNTLHVGGGVTVDNLAGSGTRMVTANASGDLATSAIPTGTVTSVNIINGGGLGVTGGPITSSGSITITAVDGSITNEGRIGVTTGGSNSAGLQGYNENGTTTGAAASITGSGGVLITETAGTPSGGTINVEAVGGHIMQVSRSSSFTNSTVGVYSVNFTNQDILLPSSSAPYVVNLSTDEFTINNTGVYELAFSGLASNSTNGPIYFERFNSSTSTWDYIYGVNEGYLTSVFQTVSFTTLANLLASDRIRVRYNVNTGATVNIDVCRLIIKRIR